MISYIKKLPGRGVLKLKRSQHLKEGDLLDAVILNIDRKNRTINLSIKAKDHAEHSAAMQKIAADNEGSSGTTNLGELLKAKLEEPGR